MSAPNETRILIIDDELAIRNVLKITLNTQNFKIADASTGAEGLERAASFHPHYIILDLGLPDMSGLEVLKKLRQWTSIPILILTVTDDEATKVSLLDSGADDYLTKPFGGSELLARIRVGLRNRREIEATPVFESGDLKVDLNSAAVTVRGETVHLTATEFALLRVLVREHGKIVAQASLLTEVWGPKSINQAHYLRIYVAQLRKKIETDPSEPRHILTESGIGYRII